MGHFIVSGGRADYGGILIKCEYILDLKDWDYSSNAAYFVTICTRERKRFFGDIKNDMMGLNEIGCLSAKYWQEIPDHFKNVQLDEWVIMPNHIHGIIILDDENEWMDESIVETLHCNVSTEQPRNVSAGKNHFFSKISPKSHSLSAIIRSYKSICTKTIHQKYPSVDFAWQPRFYDHIIFDQKGMDRIRDYIIDNPAKWHLDRNNIFP